MDHLVTVLIFAGEGLLVVLVAAAYLFFLYRRKARLAEELERRLMEVGRQRSSYLTYLKGQLARSLERYRAARPRGNVVVANADPFPDADPPALHTLRLCYGFLQQETGSVEDSQAKPQQYWKLRRGRTEKLLDYFARAERASSHWQEAQSAKQRGQLAEAQRNLRESEEKLRLARARIEDLRVYRERFQVLHDKVQKDSEASHSFRSDLRDAIRQPPDSGRIGGLIDHYEERRAPLDGFMNRQDIKPFQGVLRPNRQLPSGPHRTRRTRRLLQAADRVIDENKDALRNALKHQETLVKSLREALDEASEKEERLKTYYSKKVKDLEGNLKESERCIETLEKESYRRKRQIDELLERIERKEEEQPEVSALEEAVDRFSMQALQMTERLQALEREVGALREENAKLKAGQALAPQADPGAEVEADAIAEEAAAEQAPQV